MRIEFEEAVTLSPQAAYEYFRSPYDWARVNGVFGRVQKEPDGWFALPLKQFPFPLHAKVTREEPYRRVCWKIRGFFSGEGEVNFEPTDDGVIVWGHEHLHATWLPFVAPFVERMYLKRQFKKIWSHGFKRLRRLAETGGRTAEAA